VEKNKQNKFSIQINTYLRKKKKDRSEIFSHKHKKVQSKSKQDIQINWVLATE